jgi:hypothetical protein
MAPGRGSGRHPRTGRGCHKAGDKVIATDTKTGRIQPETVTVVMVNHDTDPYDLKIKAGTASAFPAMAPRLLRFVVARTHRSNMISMSRPADYVAHSGLLCAHCSRSFSATEGCR